MIPSNQSVEVTHTATFITSVSGVGVDKFTYQWKHNSIVIAKENESVMVIQGVTESDSGEYECTVRNENGLNVVSNRVYLSVTSESVYTLFLMRATHLQFLCRKSTISY